jgi:hypothetical protein
MSDKIYPIENRARTKTTSAIIAIEAFNGNKYTLMVDTRKDIIGLSRKDKQLGVTAKAFVLISQLVTSVEEQLNSAKEGDTKNDS